MIQTTRNIDRTFGHIDLKTGDSAPHVTRQYVLSTNLPNEHEVEVYAEWKFAIRLPVAIDEALNDEDWNLVLRRLDQRVGDNFSPLEMIFASSVCLGLSSNAIQMKIGRTVGENLYKIFVHKQMDAGNTAWLVPSSMQKVGNPHE